MKNFLAVNSGYFFCEKLFRTCFEMKNYVTIHLKKFLKGATEVKKIFLILTALVIFSSKCFAMTFSQPVEIGKVGGQPVGGFWIKGATQNSGTSYKNGQFDKEWKTKLYEKGIAIFGNGKNPLYLHYDCSKNKNRGYQDAYSPKFGNKNATKTVSLGAGEGQAVHVSQIKNDGNITLYLLCGEGPVAGTVDYVLLGVRADGAWVKYFDTREITDKYFGENLGLTKKPWYRNFLCRGDTLTISYERHQGKRGYVNEGEFRFKWDDKAQWFGVEQIVY